MISLVNCFCEPTRSKAADCFCSGALSAEFSPTRVISAAHGNLGNVRHNKPISGPQARLFNICISRRDNIREHWMRVVFG
nr:MAG TPA_asm: hypothetical protein [Caudoviricetes sp.]